MPEKIKILAIGSKYFINKIKREYFRPKKSRIGVYQVADLYTTKSTNFRGITYKYILVLAAVLDSEQEIVNLQNSFPDADIYFFGFKNQQLVNRMIKRDKTVKLHGIMNLPSAMQTIYQTNKEDTK